MYTHRYTHNVHLQLFWNWNCCMLKRHPAVSCWDQTRGRRFDGWRQLLRTHMHFFGCFVALTLTALTSWCLLGSSPCPVELQSCWILKPCTQHLTYEHIIIRFGWVSSFISSPLKKSSLSSNVYLFIFFFLYFCHHSCTHCKCRIIFMHEVW